MDDFLIACNSASCVLYGLLGVVGSILHDRYVFALDQYYVSWTCIALVHLNYVSRLQFVRPRELDFSHMNV